MGSRCVVFAFVLGLVSTVGPAAKADDTLKRSFAFEVGRWYDIESEMGAVKLYRIRLERQTGVKTFKSKITRGTNSEFLEDVQIQIEYSNKSSADWSAKLNIVWVDERGEAIDGYVGKQSLGDDTKHELATVLLSTLKYGIARAKKLEVSIEVEPD